MIRGRYRDVVRDRRGRPVADRGWASNTLVYSVWPLIAGRLRNDRALEGVTYCAVGAGDPSWDQRMPAAARASVRLVAETLRVRLKDEDLTYLDGGGRPVKHPTARLQARAALVAVGEALTLREFGLYGGTASDAPDSGYLINYVVHPRLDLRVGQTLVRRVQLSFRPGDAPVQPDWLHVPAHPLGSSPVTVIDGVGKAIAQALSGGRVHTVAELARIDPTRRRGSVPLAKLVELRAKARLALRSASDVGLIPELQDRRLSAILATSPAALAREVAAPASAVERLYEQLSVLQLTLDTHTLRGMTLADFQGGA